MQNLIIYLIVSIFSYSLTARADISKIAVIDLEYIYQNSLAAKSVKTQIEAKSAVYQAEINKKEIDLNSKNKELVKQQHILTSEAFEEKLRVFNNQVSEVQRELETKNYSLNQASDEATAKIQEKINQIVAKFAQKQAVDLVVQASQMVYYNPNLEITAEVLKELNSSLTDLAVKIDDKYNIKTNNEKLPVR